MSEKLKGRNGNPRSQVGCVSADAPLLRLQQRQQRFERLCQEVTDTLAQAGITAETALATLPQVRKRLFTRRYGTKLAKKSGRRL